MTFADLDKLNLKGFAENLLQSIEKGAASSAIEKGAYTVSLNAKFGNGKTTFLKMLKVLLKSKKIIMYYLSMHGNQIFIKNLLLLYSQNLHI